MAKPIFAGSPPTPVHSLNDFYHFLIKVRSIYSSCTISFRVANSQKVLYYDDLVNEVNKDGSFVFIKLKETQQQTYVRDLIIDIDSVGVDKDDLCSFPWEGKGKDNLYVLDSQCLLDMKRFHVTLLLNVCE